MTTETLQERWDATSAESQIPDYQKIAKLRVAALVNSMQKFDPKQLIAAHALIDLHLLRSDCESTYKRAVHSDADSFFLRGMVSMEMIDEAQYSQVIESNATGLLAVVPSLVVPDQTYELYRSVSDVCPLVIYEALATS